MNRNRERPRKKKRSRRTQEERKKVTRIKHMWTRLGRKKENIRRLGGRRFMKEEQIKSDEKKGKKMTRWKKKLGLHSDRHTDTDKKETSETERQKTYGNGKKIDRIEERDNRTIEKERKNQKKIDKKKRYPIENLRRLGKH